MPIRQIDQCTHFVKGNMFSRLHKSEEGFTLVELLVVIIVIGILAAIAVPVFLNQRHRANAAAMGTELSHFAKHADQQIAYGADPTNAATYAHALIESGQVHLVRHHDKHRYTVCVTPDGFTIGAYPWHYSHDENPIDVPMVSNIDGVGNLAVKNIPSEDIGPGGLTHFCNYTLGEGNWTRGWWVNRSSPIAVEVEAILLEEGN